MELKGVYTALVTPFHEDGALDEGSFRKLIDFQIEEGISGLVPMGTTGESPTVNHDDHLDIIRIVVEQARGRVPVIAGTGSNCTEEAVGMTQKAEKAGVDASLQVAPYYNKPSQEGFYEHFKTIAASVNIPIIVYNIPGRSGKNIENSTMLRLAEIPNIIGVKEASGNFNQIMDLIQSKPSSFEVISGDDNITFPIIALGGKGVISVASNIVPGRMIELVETALNGDMVRARTLHYNLLPLFKGVFLETNPIPIKYALSKKGMLKESYRLPLIPMSSDKKSAMDRILTDLKII